MSGNAHNTVVSVENVSKKFCKSVSNSMWYGVKDLFQEIAGLGTSRARDLRKDEFFALDDISFSLRRGESLAIMGHNGAGKTTLLKLLLGRLKPTSGRITTYGRIGAITELGLGFDLALTGRENIFIGGAVLGLSRRRIVEAFEAIVAFAELQDFIDAPVKAYSTGMRARLGYAIAAHVHPDILLVDEALAVGDIGFRRKCIYQVRDYLDRGGTLVWVSHDPYLVQSICSRCLLLDHGRTIFDGVAVEGVGRYLEIGAEFKRNDHLRKANGVSLASTPSENTGADEHSNTAVADETCPETENFASRDLVAPLVQRSDCWDAVVIRESALLGRDGEPVRHGEPALVSVRYCCATPLPPVRWGFLLVTSDLSTKIASAVSNREPGTMLRVGEGELRCVIPKLPLRSGMYALRVGLLDCLTGMPVALSGWDDPPTFFTVQAEVDYENNMYAAIGDLMSIAVEW